jgi:hypothetical protein
MVRVSNEGDGWMGDDEGGKIKNSGIDMWSTLEYPDGQSQ